MVTVSRILVGSVRELGETLSRGDRFRQWTQGAGIHTALISEADLSAVFPIGDIIARLGYDLERGATVEILRHVAEFSRIISTASANRSSAWPYPLGEDWFWRTFLLESILDAFLSGVVEAVPELLPLMQFAGLCDIVDVFARDADGVVDESAWVGSQVNWHSRRLALISQGELWFRDVYGWGSSFDYQKFGERLMAVLGCFGFTFIADDSLGIYRPLAHASWGSNCEILAVGTAGVSLGNGVGSETGAVSEDESSLPVKFGIVFAGVQSVSNIRDRGFGVGLLLGANTDENLVDEFVRVSAGASGVYGILVRPSGVEVVGASAGRIGVDINVGAMLGAVDGEPFVLGETTSLEIRRLRAHVSFERSPAGHGAETVDYVLGVLLEMEDSALIIRAGDGDGFLRTVLPSEGVSIAFAIALGWSSACGFFFRGSGGLSITLPLNVSIGGVLLIDTIHVQALVDSRGFRVSTSCTVVVHLGPIAASVQRVGLEASFLVANGTGNLGSVDANFGFKAPDGVSLSISAGPVRGGGFVTYDAVLGRYSGALALSIGSIALRAIGILDTRAPGVSGYSFLIVISAEFSPIQLGFGFTLMGVGGLCGIQRSISVPALQSGVRDGSLAPLLFSRDPIAQAAQLITGLQRIFPPTNDRYVFGPMFKLGWGTPTLVTVDLGIVLQVPSPIVIVLLGTLSASLPRPEAAVVVINLDIVGVLEVTEKRLSISASLRDSRIAAFALTGDLELRFSWGSDPEFLFSLGGFNPEFRPPPGFPTLRRLSLALGSGANPRLSLASYFAITSNTLQFGARAELHATAAGFTVQGYIEFHALIIFRPFSFRFDFAAGLSLKRGSSLLAAITVTGLLKGPRPWYIKATASITVLFFDVSVQIERTFGQAAEPELAAPVDVWTRLLPALADVRNWSATLPEGRPRGVSTAADGEIPPRVRLDPMSQLAVRQKVLPLDRRITKLGEAVIGPPARFEIRAVRVGANAAGAAGTPLTARPVEEPFAAAQYQTLTDAEKLSRPSFEPMAAGVEALGNAVRAGGQQRAPVQWRTLRLEPSDRDATTPPGPISATRAGKLGAVDAAKGAALRTTGMERFAPPEGKRPLVALAPEAWTVASKTDLRAREGVSPSKAQGASDEALREIPEGERKDWQVVPVRGGRG